MNEPLLKIEHLNKSYGKKKVLKNVSFSCGEGGIIGLLGPNGSGKTTMLKIITGVLTAYDGMVQIGGNNVGNKTKSIISYLSDEPYFPDHMKVKEALRVFSDFYYDFDLNKCMQMLKRFQIERNMSLKTMSKGTKEKFQLSLVMSRNAKLIILDEPIGGVDPAAREVILDTILSNYNERQTILIATHLIAEIERIFDTVLFIKDGEIILNEPVEDLRSRTGQSVDQCFREMFRY